MKRNIDIDEKAKALIIEAANKLLSASKLMETPSFGSRLILRFPNEDNDQAVDFHVDVSFDLVDSVETTQDAPLTKVSKPTSDPMPDKMVVFVIVLIFSVTLACYLILAGFFLGA